MPSSPCQFQLVDLSDQIRQDLASATGDSGFTGSMHLPFTREDGAAKAVTIPIQTGMATGDPPVYGDDTWGPCPWDLRASMYHDPVVPGSVNPATGCIWVAERGYVPADQAPPQNSVVELTKAAHDAVNRAVTAALKK